MNYKIFIEVACKYNSAFILLAIVLWMQPAGGESDACSHLGSCRRNCGLLQKNWIEINKTINLICRKWNRMKFERLELNSFQSPLSSAIFSALATSSLFGRQFDSVSSHDFSLFDVSQITAMEFKLIQRCQSFGMNIWELKCRKENIVKIPTSSAFDTIIKQKIGQISY